MTGVRLEAGATLSVARSIRLEAQTKYVSKAQLTGHTPVDLDHSCSAQIGVVCFMLFWMGKVEQGTMVLGSNSVISLETVE